jgi:uracil-DNA glycosylase family 4
MDEVKQIIENAQTGNHPACKSCLRNPQRNDTSFAYTCEEHYGMNKNGLIIIACDPGASGGGSSHLGKLCLIHNNDVTAKRLLSKLTLLKVPNQSIYFLNAILHGYFDVNSKKKNNAERKCCMVILKEIIHCLQPKVILALGLEALQSSIEILQKSGIKKPTMKGMIGKTFSYGQLAGVNVFAMPHPAYASVNLSKHGLNETEVWKELANKINKTMC